MQDATSEMQSKNNVHKFKKSAESQAQCLTSVTHRHELLSDRSGIAGSIVLASLSRKACVLIRFPNASRLLFRLALRERRPDVPVRRRHRRLAVPVAGAVIRGRTRVLANLHATGTEQRTQSAAAERPGLELYAFQNVAHAGLRRP